MHSDQPAILYGLGIVYELTNRLQEAADYYAAALRFDPHYPLAHYHLGRLMLDNEDYRQAVHFLERAYHCDTDNDLDGTDYLQELAEGYIRIGNFGDAHALLDKMLELDNGHIPALLLKGEAYVCMGRKEEARAMYERARAMKPDSEEICGIIDDALKYLES